MIPPKPRRARGWIKVPRMCVLADEPKRAKTCIIVPMADLKLENQRLLDVIDENDRVIETRSRSEIHRLGLLHRDIHVWMFDKDHNIFFQKRGVSVLWAGLLDSTVGGHLNAGEQYLVAAVRETEEETGISVLPTDLVFLKKFKSVMNIPKGYFPKVINNFIRHLYIYKYPVKESQLKEEKGILGVGFRKFSAGFINNLKKEDERKFAECVLKEELPEVIKYLRDQGVN